MVQTVLIALNTFVSYICKYPASIIWFSLFYIYFALLTVHVFRPVALSLNRRGCIPPLEFTKSISVVARMTAVMHFQVPCKGENLFTGWKNDQFSKKKLLNKANWKKFWSPWHRTCTYDFLSLSETRTQIHLYPSVFWLHRHWYFCPF